MRIDKLNSVSSYNKVLPEKAVKSGAEEEKKAPTTDRVEVSKKPSANELNGIIKENVIKVAQQKISPDRLEELKQKISQNKYHVDTTDIVKSILE